MVAASPETEREHAHALVKGEDASIFIAAELRGDKGQQSGLTCTGRPEYERVPQIASMDVEPERRGVVRHQDGQRLGVWRVKWARAYRGACPH